MLRVDPLGHGHDGRPVGDVRRQGHDVQPLEAELGRRLLGQLCVDVAEHDTRPLGGEDRRDTAPDASRGTGHDCDLIVETLHPGRYRI